MVRRLNFDHVLLAVQAEAASPLHCSARSGRPLEMWVGGVVHLPKPTACFVAWLT